MDDYLKPVMRGTLTTDENGQKHFVYGKLRLNVTEHFAEKGKTFRELLDEIILEKAHEAMKSAA
ncbi:MAG: hypothetical protein NC548_48960 [Lachnospiraceae bacterium]|nr:hypothetical protein [Lachnospiraceae bacterium]